MITRDNRQVGVGLETIGGGRGQEQQGQALVESEELGRGFGSWGERQGGGEGTYHTRQDEVDASASPVSDAIDGASLT